jgi:hypothetical protein
MSTFIKSIKRRADRDIKLAELIKDSYKDARKLMPLEADQWIRVSSLGMVCPREEVLCAMHSVIRNDIVDGDSGVNFEQGHAVHWMFQSRILAKAGVMIGAWRCTYCGTQYGSRSEGYIPRPARCVRCGAVAEEPGRANGRPDDSVNGNAFVYVEEWIGNAKYKIGGSPDGYMMAEYRPDYNNEDLTLLEFKSANERNFIKYKDAPDFVHVIQAQLYMWLTGCRKAKAVYFNKNERGMAGVAEHDFNYDPECIDRVIEAVQEIRTGIVNSEPPPRVVCMSADCPRAMRCHVQELCFNGETKSGA